jgi:hypothetical protein
MRKNLHAVAFEMFGEPQPVAARQHPPHLSYDDPARCKFQSHRGNKKLRPGLPLAAGRRRVRKHAHHIDGVGHS